jgi:hypothetical protein
LREPSFWFVLLSGLVAIRARPLSPKNLVF